MWSPYRKKHLLILLELALDTNRSLDFCTHSYFKKNKSLGSKDRVIIKKAIYDIIKWKELLIAYGAKNPEELCNVYMSERCPIGKKHAHLPNHTQVSFPKWLYDKIEQSLGKEEAKKFCFISNEQAPTTIRVNTSKITAEEFFEKYKDIMNLKPLKNTKSGFEVQKKMQYISMDSFKNGEFEPQDEASQIICEYVDAKPSMHILDYCSASGGKTLGFAGKMEGKGQVHLHDVRKSTLQEAKKRLKKANFQNFQLYFNEEKRMKKLINNMDRVLVDAPCSCSGTLRRRPDHKWFLQEQDLENLVTLQKEIIDKAIKYVKPRGRIIYATCSVLNEENDKIKEYLDSKENFEYITSKSLALQSGGSDSMYLCVFEKKNLD